MILGLLILGIILIILSIILIIKYNNDENIKMMKINELYNDIDEYSNTLNDIITNLEDLINTDNKNDHIKINKLEDINIKEDESISQEYPNNKTIKEEILLLYKEGKTKDEIAKILNKGKREIEIILKLNDIGKI